MPHTVSIDYPFSGAFESVAAAVRAIEPEIPMLCLRPQVAAAEARHFVGTFPGQVLYALKCNPDERILRALRAGGIRHFDAASIGEVRLARGLFPDARIHFMHPVKARSAIREAYAAHGVRDFVLDTREELEKIIEETAEPEELLLVVRLALAKGNARLDLSGKFGAPPGETATLLQAASALGARVGVSFHVGSQCCDPTAWERALAQVGQVVQAAGVPVDVIDVGGGFPVCYPDMTPPPLEAFVAAIQRGLAGLELPEWCDLWCEPGRALVAASESVVVQVQSRRGDTLYVNDGVYGSLSDAGALLHFRYPCRVIRAAGRESRPEQPFSLFGPTCDSLDRMQGPFMLPADVAEGDWIEIGQLGAYGACLRTAFNGFDSLLRVEVGDGPLGIGLSALGNAEAA